MSSPPPPPAAQQLPIPVVILLANVNPLPNRPILFPTVESCKLDKDVMKTGSVPVWKVNNNQVKKNKLDIVSPLFGEPVVPN